MRISDSSSDVCSSDRALVVGQDRGGLGVVGGQAGAHGFLGVVGAPLELAAAAVVADPGNLGLLVALVVAGPQAGSRSEDSRVGKEVVGPCRFRWSSSNQ